MTATILVVDDEPDLEALILQKFRRQVREGSVNFMFARDGLEALQSLEQHPHVDWWSPTSTCREWTACRCWPSCRNPRKRNRTIIVYGDMSNIRTAMNRGAFDFLTKPIDFADLEARSTRRCGISKCCATLVDVRRKPSAPMPRSPAISRPNSQNGLGPASATAPR